MKPIIVAAALAASGPASAAPGYETYAKLYERLRSGATAPALEDELPGLAANLKTASEVSAEYWTDSTTYDELAKEYILPDDVLDALGIRHEITGGVVHVPAGMMHTYGYLFSQLKTAYGLKGKRWIESRVDERLGLPAGTFGPVPPEGEFASNVTAAFLKLTASREAQAESQGRRLPRAEDRLEDARRQAGEGGRRHAPGPAEAAGGVREPRLLSVDLLRDPRRPAPPRHRIPRLRGVRGRDHEDPGRPRRRVPAALQLIRRPVLDRRFRRDRRLQAAIAAVSRPAGPKKTGSLAGNEGLKYLLSGATLGP
jgi:hypothetical protein